MNCLDLERPERGVKTLVQAFLKSYEQFLFWSSQPSHLEISMQLWISIIETETLKRAEKCHH